MFISFIKFKNNKNLEIKIYILYIHEISLIGKINQFIKEKRLPTDEKGKVIESTIKKYERWLYNIIIKNFNKLANDEILMYNMIMYDGIIDGKNKVKFGGEMVNPMEYFDEFIEMIIYGGDGNKGAVDVLPIIQTTTTTTTQKYEPPTYDFDDEDEDEESPTDDDDDDDISWLDED